ncbi:MAG: hypothetical protein ACTSX4_13270, partial [Candidatus Helarchaeota archaeon]
MNKLSKKKRIKKNALLISIVISVLMISFFIQISFVQTSFRINNDGDKGNISTPVSRDEPIYLDTASSANITDLNVQKTETISIEVSPRGEIGTTSAKIDIEIENTASHDTYFNFVDRVEGGKEDTFHVLLDTPEPNLTTKHGILFINWTDVFVGKNNKTELHYLVDTDKEIPIEINVSYFVNNTIPVTFENDSTEIHCPIGSNFTASIRMRSKNNSFYGSRGLINPILLAIITAVFPEDNFGDVYSTLPKLMENKISFANQISWATIVTNESVLNFSTPVIDGGGWGIIELEPLRVDLIFSADMFSALFTAAAAAIGLQTGLEIFWSYLTFESMLDQFITISNLLELLVDVMVSDTGVLNSIMYSAVGNIDFANMDLTSLLSIANQNGSIYSLIKLDRLYNFINDIQDDSVFENPLNPFDYLDDGYLDSKDQLLSVIDQIKAGIISSIGAQLISIFGTPINITYEASNKTREIWNSSEFVGYELTNAIMSNDLDHNDLPELILSMYNATTNTSLIVLLEYNNDKENPDYLTLWNSSQSSSLGGPSDTNIYGKIANGSLQVGDLDGDDDREIIFGTNDGNITVFEFVPTLLGAYSVERYRRHDYSINNAITSLLVPDVNIQTNSKNIIYGLSNGTIVIIDPADTGNNHNPLTISSTEWHKNFGGAITDISIGNTDGDNFIELLFYNTTHFLIYENITNVPSLTSGLNGLWNVSLSSTRFVLNDVTINGSTDIISIKDNVINVSESVINISTVVVSPTETITYETVEGYNTSIWGTNVTSEIDNSTTISSLHTGDLDEDGRTEIIVSLKNGTIHFYEWAGQG